VALKGLGFGKELKLSAFTTFFFPKLEIKWLCVMKNN